MTKPAFDEQSTRSRVSSTTTSPGRRTSAGECEDRVASTKDRRLGAADLWKQKREAGSQAVGVALAVTTGSTRVGKSRSLPGSGGDPLQGPIAPG